MVQVALQQEALPVILYGFQTVWEEVVEALIESLIEGLEELGVVPL